ncbi:hypothetical protein SY88_15815 [Clostridiales bacterium PH28_bin88]|nr:hypothetical protein SY88_15815 [Clostridiales bacterium PH28_bin88]
MLLNGALVGLKVMDLTHYVAGPFCCQILGDLGAEVIKVEQPGVGEAARSFPPFINGEGIYYANFNRNKKGITLNLNDPRGQKVFKQLVAETDVLVTNYKPSYLKKIGISFEELQPVNPSLIMLSISGFGNEGPYKDKAAFDMIVQAMTGFMYLNGEPGGLPVRGASVVADYAAAFYGAISILTALQYRQKTGEGQHIDVALYDAIISMMQNLYSNYFYLQEEPERTGNGSGRVAVMGLFSAKDGMIYVAAQANNLFEKLCRVMGLPELLEDERFRTPALRKENEAVLNELVGSWMAKQDVATVERLLDEAGIPNGPVKTIGQVCRDEHARQRGTFAQIDHPVMGKIIVPGLVPRFSKSPGAIKYPPPTLGQHNEEVLGALGYSREEIEAMRQDQVI